MDSRSERTGTGIDPGLDTAADLDAGGQGHSGGGDGGEGGTGLVPILNYVSPSLSETGFIYLSAWCGIMSYHTL